MSFFNIAFKSSLVYRYSVVFSIFGSILSIGINILLWRFLYINDVEMVNYMTKYTILSSLISMFYVRGISRRIGNKVSSGEFAIDLIKPINIFTMSWELELADVTSNFILKGLPVIIFYFPLLINTTKYNNIFLFILSLILGHILFLLIYSLLGFSAYILMEIWPFGRLIDDTIRLLSGSFIPIAILPGFLKNIANILPFKFLYSVPLELLFGKISTIQIIENILSIFLWIVVFGILNIIMYKSALKKAIVQGG